jgi:hypothetical protein
VLVSLWLFLFSVQPNEFLLDGVKKLEQRVHTCVELRGEYVEKIYFVRFEVLTTMKIYITFVVFWVKSPCTLAGGHRRFINVD